MTATGGKGRLWRQMVSPTEKDCQERGMPKGVFFWEGGMLGKAAAGWGLRDMFTVLRWQWLPVLNAWREEVADFLHPAKVRYNVHPRASGPQPWQQGWLSSIESHRAVLYLTSLIPEAQCSQLALVCYMLRRLWLSSCCWWRTMADGHNSTQCATEQATHYLFLLFPKKKMGEDLLGECKNAGWLPFGAEE